VSDITVTVTAPGHSRSFTLDESQVAYLRGRGFCPNHLWVALGACLPPERVWTERTLRADEVKAGMRINVGGEMNHVINSQQTMSHRIDSQLTNVVHRVTLRDHGSLYFRPDQLLQVQVLQSAEGATHE